LEVSIRFAKAGEKISLLPEGGKIEDRVVELDGTELVIADGSTDTPVGLAGVKGGRYAEINPGTKNIIIEAAHFNPTTTRKTARRLGIVTDASKRFENEPVRDLPPYAQQEVIRLIIEIAGGTLEGIVDEYLEKSEANPVKISSDRINKLLGLSLSQAEIIKLLVQIGSSVKDNGDGTLTATQPFERTDLTLEVNFAEEVGRIYGLDKITSIKPEQRPLLK
jgi:phenylalanyl-tRNA synthetase beta chain